MKVLKFGAIWCKECLVMKPMWQDIEASIPELVAEYYDADENPEVLEKYSVKDIPVFIFLDNFRILIVLIGSSGNIVNI